MKTMKSLILVAVVMATTTAGAESISTKKIKECKQFLRIKYKKGNKRYKVVVPASVIRNHGYCNKPFKRKVNRDEETRG